jgi:predicted flavoprotein YhiN
LSKEAFLSAEQLAENIKAFPLKITGTAPIDEAISTVGGIALTEVSANLELNKMPNNFCLGEMLDWDAPTGGYLLQANLSIGYYLANYFNTSI